MRGKGCKWHRRRQQRTYIFWWAVFASAWIVKCWCVNICHYAWHGPFTLQITLNLFASTRSFSHLFAGHQPKMCQICLKISWNKSWQVPNAAAAVSLCTARINPFAVNIINGSDGAATLFQFTAIFERCQLYHFVLCESNEIMHARTHHTHKRTPCYHTITRFCFREKFSWRQQMVFFPFICANDFRLTIIYFRNPDQFKVIVFSSSILIDGH